MIKKIFFCLMNCALLLGPCVIAGASESIDDSPIEVTTEVGNYYVTAVDAHVVNWDAFTRDGMKYVSVQCEIENIDYQNDLTCYMVAQTGVQLLDEEGFSTEFADIVGGDIEDGEYEVGASIPLSTKKRVSLPFYVPEDCEKVTVVINNEFSQEFSLEDTSAIEDTVNSEVEKEGIPLQDFIDQASTSNSDDIVNETENEEYIEADQENELAEESESELETETETKQTTEAEMQTQEDRTLTAPDKDISGIITEATMNAVTIQTEDGETYICSTEDTDFELTNGIIIGLEVNVNLNNSISDENGVFKADKISEINREDINEDEIESLPEEELLTEIEEETDEKVDSPSTSVYDPFIYTDTETVVKVQEALNSAGYDCGTPDGKAGSQTQMAIKQYQEDEGLDVTGNINDDLLLSLGILNNSISENNLAEVKQEGVSVATFVDRYNYAVDFYNALPDITVDERVTNIAIDDIESSSSFRPDNRFTITMNSNMDNKENIVSFYANMDENDIISDEKTMAEATALIYALDVSLKDFSEALDVYDIILDSASTEYNNIIYTVSASNGGLTVTGMLEEHSIVAENKENNDIEFNNNYGSSDEELAAAIIGNLDNLINNAGKTLEHGEIAKEMYLTYNGSVSLAIMFELTSDERSYLIIALPDPDTITDSNLSDYVEFLAYLAQASDEKLSESQAYTMLNNTIPNEGEVYEENNNNYIYQSPLFAVQIMK